MNHCHIWKSPSCQAPWNWQSSSHSVFGYMNLPCNKLVTCPGWTCSHSNIYKYCLPYTSCTHAATYQHTLISMFHGMQYTVTHSHAKHAGPLLIQTNFGFIWQSLCCKYSSGFFTFSLAMIKVCNLCCFVSNGFLVGCSSHFLTSHWNTSSQR